MTTNQLPALAEGTIYIVGLQKLLDIAGGRFASAGQNFALSRNGSSDGVIATAGTSGLETLSDSANDDTFYTWRIRMTETHFFLSKNNGVEQSSTRTPSSSAAQVLLFYNAGAAADKQLATLAIFTVSHDSATMNQVEDYLKDKYNHY